MIRILFIVVTLTLLNISQGMAESPSAKLVKLVNGVNSVDFTGDGIPDLIVIGRRDNFNAHGFDVVSFYIFTDDKEFSVKQWDIVPIMKKEKERLEVTVSGGADCILHDFRLLSGSSKTAASLILADRELRNSYADSETVTFTYFSLETNREGIPGEPRYYFKQSRVVKSKAKYCDVGEAFQKELGIDSYRRPE
jgi:hypothetical protein